MSTRDVSTGVCIVGSGAAGITLAWFLDRAGIEVTLIDASRDVGTWPPADDRNPVPSKFYRDKLLLYDGDSVGKFQTNYEERGLGNFLVLPNTEHTGPPSERELYLGGTTNHWGGQSRSLDPVTFKGYAGYPGWPVKSSELAPYYTRAARLVRLASDDFSAEYWAEKLGDEVPDMPGFETAMYQFMGGAYLHFATNRFDADSATFGPEGQTLEESSIRVLRNATLLEIDAANGHVDRLRVGTMGDGDPPKPGEEFTITADAYVLACGAVANARQLLLSNVANSSGLVGRYFMCHPLVFNTVFVSGRYLTPKQENLMNGRYANGMQYRSPDGVRVSGRFIPDAATATEKGIGRCWFWVGGGSYYFEQAPNRDSRITLAESVDPVFGQRQTEIRWAFDDLDRKTFDEVKKLFTDAVAYSNEKTGGDGSVSFQSWDWVQSTAVVNGHHLGTTRMSDDPTQGVVDANLRTHDVDNLYVAGSSPWTSAGISNPTFSIIMFSIRLADHLSQKLAG